MLENPLKIAIAEDNNYLLAVGVGNIDAYSIINDKRVQYTLKNVLYVPGLRRNLLSVKKLDIANISVIFENGCVKLLSNEYGLIMSGKMNSLYELSFFVPKPECLNIENVDNTFEKLHRRYGHIGFSNLKILIKNNLVEGLEKNIKINNVQFCEPCVNGKMSKLSFGERTKAKRILAIIHSDVCGPMAQTTYDDYSYFVTFIDDYSNFTMVYLLKHKSEVFENFKEYFNMVQ